MGQRRARSAPLALHLVAAMEVLEERHIFHRVVVRLLERKCDVGIDLKLHVIDQGLNLPRGAKIRDECGAHCGGHAVGE